MIPAKPEPLGQIVLQVPDDDADVGYRRLSWHLPQSPPYVRRHAQATRPRIGEWL